MDEQARQAIKAGKPVEGTQPFNPTVRDSTATPPLTQAGPSGSGQPGTPKENRNYKA